MGAEPPLSPAHLPYHPFWLPCALGLSDNLQYGRLCLNSGNFHMLFPLSDLFFPLDNPTHFSRVSTNVSSSRKHFLIPKLGSLFYTSSEHLFAKHIYTSFCLKNDVWHKCSQSGNSSNLEILFPSPCYGKEFSTKFFMEVQAPQCKST